MNELKELVAILMDGGPYAITGISLLVSAYLYKARENDRKASDSAMTLQRAESTKQLNGFRESSRTEHETKNEKLFKLAEKMASTIATSDANQTQLTDVVKELLREVRANKGG